MLNNIQLAIVTHFTGFARAARRLWRRPSPSTSLPSPPPRKKSSSRSTIEDDCLQVGQTAGLWGYLVENGGLAGALPIALVVTDLDKLSDVSG